MSTAWTKQSITIIQLGINEQLSAGELFAVQVYATSANTYNGIYMANSALPAPIPLQIATDTDTSPISNYIGSGQIVKLTAPLSAGVHIPYEITEWQAGYAYNRGDLVWVQAYQDLYKSEVDNNIQDTFSMEVPTLLRIWDRYYADKITEGVAYNVLANSVFYINFASAPDTQFNGIYKAIGGGFSLRMSRTFLYFDLISHLENNTIIKCTAPYYNGATTNNTGHASDVLWTNTLPANPNVSPPIVEWQANTLYNKVYDPAIPRYNAVYLLDSNGNPDYSVFFISDIDNNKQSVFKEFYQYGTQARHVKALSTFPVGLEQYITDSPNHPSLSVLAKRGAPFYARDTQHLWIHDGVQWQMARGFQIDDYIPQRDPTSPDFDASYGKYLFGQVVVGKLKGGHYENGEPISGVLTPDRTDIADPAKVDDHGRNGLWRFDPSHYALTYKDPTQIITDGRANRIHQYEYFYITGLSGTSLDGSVNYSWYNGIYFAHKLEGIVVELTTTLTHPNALAELQNMMDNGGITKLTPFTNITNQAIPPTDPNPPSGVGVNTLYNRCDPFVGNTTVIPEQFIYIKRDPSGNYSPTGEPDYTRFYIVKTKVHTGQNFDPDIQAPSWVLLADLFDVAQNYDANNNVVADPHFNDGYVYDGYLGKDHFPPIGRKDTVYIDTSQEPYKLYVWDGMKYVSVGDNSYPYVQELILEKESINHLLITETMLTGLYASNDFYTHLKSFNPQLELDLTFDNYINNPHYLGDVNTYSDLFTSFYNPAVNDFAVVHNPPPPYSADKQYMWGVDPNNPPSMSWLPAPTIFPLTVPETHNIRMDYTNTNTENVIGLDPDLTDSKIQLEVHERWFDHAKVKTEVLLKSLSDDFKMVLRPNPTTSRENPFYLGNVNEEADLPTVDAAYVAGLGKPFQEYMFYVVLYVSDPAKNPKQFYWKWDYYEHDDPLSPMGFATGKWVDAGGLVFPIEMNYVLDMDYTGTYVNDVRISRQPTKMVFELSRVLLGHHNETVGIEATCPNTDFKVSLLPTATAPDNPNYMPNVADEASLPDPLTLTDYKFCTVDADGFQRCVITDIDGVKKWKNTNSQMMFSPYLNYELKFDMQDYVRNCYSIKDAMITTNPFKNEGLLHNATMYGTDPVSSTVMQYIKPIHTINVGDNGLRQTTTVGTILGLCETVIDLINVQISTKVP